MVNLIIALKVNRGDLILRISLLLLEKKLIMASMHATFQNGNQIYKNNKANF